MPFWPIKEHASFFVKDGKFGWEDFSPKLIDKLSEVFLGCLIEHSFYVWHYLDEFQYV